MNRRSARYQEAVEQGFDEEFEAKFFAQSLRESKVEVGINDDPWPAYEPSEDELPF